MLIKMSNAILILNLLRPKPKPRRYHIAYIKTWFGKYWKINLGYYLQCIAEMNTLKRVLYIVK